MNFLQAHATLKAFAGGPQLPVLLAMSGLGEPLELYLRAAGAEAGYQVDVRFLPFGTLRQSLINSPPPDQTELLLLFPWDLTPELDWRTGVTERIPSKGVLHQQASEIIAQLERRGSRLLYIDVAGAPLWLDAHRNTSWQTMLRSMLEGLGAEILPADVFSIGSYLSSGQPIATKEAGTVARAVVRSALATRLREAKVLVTDLDHTLWHGIVGDDGATGVHFGPEGKGYRHFVYQSFLRRLRADGVILAAVSKNTERVAREPFSLPGMVLKEEDFVAIVASWQPKSVQIEMLAEQLNLGLDAFVFVDDNPVELAEVAARLPPVDCVEFPRGEQSVLTMIDSLVRRFRRTRITAEDRDRTALYRRRLETLPPRTGNAADIREFLRGLEMVLTIEERTRGDRIRAVQLINKTNQFNINGERIEDAEIERQVANGGRLFSASLSDRSGDHGQILAALIMPDGTITSLVMSCRVFQRRVEFAFLAWLAANGPKPTAVSFIGTARNEPARTFLSALTGEPVADGMVDLTGVRLQEVFADDLSLFSVSITEAEQ